MTQQAGITTLAIHGRTVIRAMAGGPAPGAAAYDPSNGLLYVTNGGSGRGGQSVSVFSGHTGHLLKTIKLHGSPGPIAYDRKSARLFVAMPSGQVVAISGSTNSVLATINTSSGLDRLASDPTTGDPFVTVYNQGSGSTVTVIDTTNLSILTNITVGTGPDDVTYDSIDDLVFMANSNSGDVSVIDPSTLKVISTISMAFSLTGIAFNPSDGNVYVANYNSGIVSAINGSSLKVIANITLKPGLDYLAYSPFHYHIVATDVANGRIYLIRGG